MELNIEELRSEINQELENYSEEDLRKELIEKISKQRATQRKYYDPEKAKLQRQKQAAKLAAMKEKAKELGIMDEIDQRASEKADEILAEEVREEEVGS